MIKQFDEVFVDKTRLGKKIPKEEYKKKGKYIIIDQGKDKIAGFTNNEDGIFTDVPTIIFGDHTRIIKYIDKPFFLGADGVKVLKSKINNANYKYLYYALKAAYIPNTGYNRHFKWLKKVSINYPSFEKQKRIVKLLDNLSEVKNKKNEELKLCDTLIKARFVEMFGDPLRNDRTWPISKLKLLTTKIGSGATPKGGKQSYKKEGITLVRSMNVHDGEFVYKDLAYIDTAQAHDLDNVELQPKDVFINITGASVARSCVIPDNILPGRVNQHVAIIRCKENLLNYIFLNRLFLNSSFKQKLLAMGQAGGATRQALTQEQLKKLNLILPPIELQNEFASFVQQVDKSKVVNASIMKYIISIRFYLYFKENKEGAR